MLKTFTLPAILILFAFLAGVWAGSSVGYARASAEFEAALIVKDAEITEVREYARLLEQELALTKSELDEVTMVADEMYAFIVWLSDKADQLLALGIAVAPDHVIVTSDDIIIVPAGEDPATYVVEAIGGGGEGLK